VSMLIAEILHCSH